MVLLKIRSGFVAGNGIRGKINSKGIRILYHIGLLLGILVIEKLNRLILKKQYLLIFQINIIFVLFGHQTWYHYIIMVVSIFSKTIMYFDLLPLSNNISRNVYWD